MQSRKHPFTSKVWSLAKFPKESGSAVKALHDPMFKVSSLVK